MKISACFLKLVLMATMFVWSGHSVVVFAANESPTVVFPGEDGIQRAIIIMESYTFTPQHVVVQAGKPVEFTLNNESFLVPHNFILDEPTLGLQVDESVWGGETATVQFTPMQPGTYTFFCDKQLPLFPSHREEGMEGRLEVR